MTIEELDNALGKMGLNLDSEGGQRTKNLILSNYGKYLITSYKSRCGHCWLKDNNRCTDDCPVKHLPDDPVKMAVDYLSTYNEVKLMPFIVMFVVPVYEQTTGETNFMEKFKREYQRMWKKTHKDNGTRLDY